MDITVKTLLNSLTKVKPGVGHDKAMPLLQNYYLKGTLQGIEAKATNLYDWVEHKDNKLRAEQEFSVYVPQLMYNLLRELPGELEGKLTVTENGNLCLEFPGKKYLIPAIAGAEYPEAPAANDGDTKSFTIDAKLFISMLDKVTFALVNDSFVRWNSAVFVEIANNTLCCTATEGTLLAHCEREIPETGITASFLLHKDSVAKLKKTLSEGELTVRFNEKQAFFKRGDLRIVCKLINVKYPAYRDVVPQAIYSAQIDRISLLDALKRTGAIMEKEANSETVKFKFKKEYLEIKGAVSEEKEDDLLSDTKLEIEAGNVNEGDEFFVSYKLVSMVSLNMTTEKVAISWVDRAKPILLAENEGTKNYYLVQTRRGWK